MNLKEVRASILGTGLVDLDFLSTSVREFEDQSLRAHVAWMKATDVLVGVHGKFGPLCDLHCDPTASAAHDAKTPPPKPCTTDSQVPGSSTQFSWSAAP